MANGSMPAPSIMGEVFKFLKFCCVAIASVYLAATIVFIKVLHHPAWHEHLVRFMWRTWDGFVALHIGSTSPGFLNSIVETILCIVLGFVGLIFFQGGWSAVRSRIIETVAMGIVVSATALILVYGTQFAWEVVKSGYSDHETLVAKANAPKPVCPTCPLCPIPKPCKVSSGPSTATTTQPRTLSELQTKILLTDLSAGYTLKVRINAMGSQDTISFADELRQVFKGWDQIGNGNTSIAGAGGNVSPTSELEFVIPNPQDRAVQIAVRAFDHAHIQYTKNVDPYAYRGATSAGEPPALTINVRDR